MRLLFATSNLGGGTGSHLVRLLEHMDLAPGSAELVCFGRRDLEPPESVALIDASERSVFSRFPIAQWQQYRRIRKLVRKRPPDVLHTYFFWPIVYGRLLKRAGLVHTLIENREDEGFNLSRTDYRVLRLTRSAPDRIVCVSEGVRRVVLEREGVAEKKAVVIRNGVSLPTDDVLPGAVEAVRSELGIQTDEKVVGMVANLNRPVKGVRYLIEAVPEIAREVPNARFLIVGDGALRRGLEDQARRLGVADKLIFAGFRSDIGRLYRVMDLSVLTSLSEGLSMTILESMSYGLPVVATAVGGNPELVRDGVTGVLVPPKDPAAFSRPVVRLLRDPHLRNAMGGEGQEVIRREFTLDAVADRYQELYSATSDEPSSRNGPS